MAAEVSLWQSNSDKKKTAGRGGWGQQTYLRVLPLPGLQDGGSLVLIPVDMGDHVIALQMVIHLLGGHQLEHGL